MRAIISRGLYIFPPFFTCISLFSRTFLMEIIFLFVVSGDNDMLTVLMYEIKKGFGTILHQNWVSFLQMLTQKYYE